ncbi:hypothetical protein [Nocardia sp. IFM 10818]
MAKPLLDSVVHRRLLRQFGREVRHCRIHALTDGGGLEQAALEPLVGAGPVAQVLARIAAASLRIDDGRITGLYAVRNPEKLLQLGHEIALRRWMPPVHPAWARYDFSGGTHG